ncbi:MAG: BadF/BadG/BcrA/BcrD ATPase family protein [Candidatus Acidiferrales bacterium]
MVTYSLGVDGGGSKTDCVILRADGEIIGRGAAGPSNPLRVGFPAALDAVRSAAAMAMAEANLVPRQITAAVAGLAGAGRRNTVRRALVFLTETLPNATNLVTTDFEIALETAVGTGEGIVLIAGTGSAAFGRTADGETARAGGYGPWIGDEGSAYDIGRHAVAAVAHTRDHAAPVTLLAEMIAAHIDCPSWEDLQDRIAQHPDQVFPKLFPVVVAAADAGDSAAQEILFAAALALSQLALTVARRLGLQPKAFPLARVGGVFGRSRTLDSMLDSVLRSGAPLADVTHLTISPAVGAARMAQRLAGPLAVSATHGGSRS